MVIDKEGERSGRGRGKGTRVRGRENGREGREEGRRRGSGSRLDGGRVSLSFPGSNHTCDLVVLTMASSVATLYRNQQGSFDWNNARIQSTLLVLVLALALGYSLHYTLSKLATDI